MISINYRRKALRDLDEIRAYLSLFDEAAAERVRLHLVRRIRQLGQTPTLGKATRVSGLRVLYPTKYPYRIYYLYEGDAVVILHIRHTSRKPPSLIDVR
jgi:toxin ParE1/3/4